MKMTTTCLLPAFAILALALTPADAQAGDAALAADWNEIVLSVAEAEDGFLTLKGLRTVTMMHLAMHGALHATDADSAIAASQAAYRVASDQYPDQEPRFAALHNQWLSAAARSGMQEIAIARGDGSANTVLADRDGDGWDGEAEYRWHPMAPGVYAEFEEHSGTPKGFIFGAGWARARGFALTSPDQFRAPPPPDISSDAYTQAFNEVKDIGRFQSMIRTQEQTHIALWWKDFAENSHNRLARDLVKRESLSLQDSTRLFALLNMAIYDGYISSFDNKFFYNHWRPYTAIRWAEHDGNPNTVAEPTWTNTHRHTYAFPSYPSAHGTACAAAMTVFESVFGDDYAFTMRIPMVDIAGPFSGKIEMHPPTRDFENFSSAAMQCGLSRVYLGIHFRYDSIEGVRLGEKVGANVLKAF